MKTLSADTPLYNHPLPEIERWLINLGCQQDKDALHCWRVQRSSWKAEIRLEIEELIVSYVSEIDSGSPITRAFKYSLSRQDIEDAVFSGP